MSTGQAARRAVSTLGRVRTGTARSLGPVRRRRATILALNAATVSALFAGMAWILSHGGIIAIEWAMLAAYAMTLPWLSIGLWNSLIGYALDRRHGAAAAAVVTPALRRVSGDEPIASRTAIVMPLRNEDPDASLARLRRLQEGLSRTPWGARFEYHVLSDTDRPEIALREEARVAQWRRAARGVRIHYRRREDNTGYKAGNVAEFVHRCAERYDFFLPLDADSVMGPDAVLRLVRVMQASPEMGMLQSLVTGLPSRTFFTRAFQFGMRHGMRSYTLGSAWWQADCGPNWGHNALIRMAPFAAHCMLPVLPGKGPLSGHILSHDQVEAALMRRAGWEVRVLAEEGESHEENPPSVVDFIRRELRWCNGNFQYARLLGLPGLRPVSRIQLLLAIQMYLNAPAWIAFVLLGAGLAAVPGQVEPPHALLGLGFFALVMTLNLMPKVMGIAQVLARPAELERYGGAPRLLAGALAEVAVSMLVAPVVALAVTRFAFGLVFGRRVGWEAQQRSRERLRWGEAAAVLWPQTLLGLALAGWLAAVAPWTLWIAGPILAAFALAIPVAVLTTWPALGQWSREAGLFDIPEDRSPTPAATLPEPVVDIA